MLVDGDTIAPNSDIESQRSCRVKFLDGKKWWSPWNPFYFWDGPKLASSQNRKRITRFVQIITFSGAATHELERALRHEARYRFVPTWSFDRARFNGFPLILVTLSKVEDDEGRVRIGCGRVAGREVDESSRTRRRQKRGREKKEGCRRKKETRWRRRGRRTRRKRNAEKEKELGLGSG